MNYQKMNYQKMEPKAKAAWLAALRSGRYKQGKGKLRSAENTYCCLGVLCDLGRAQAWEVATTKDRFTYAGRSEWLALEIEKAAGLDDAAQRELAQKNDDGWSFESIANWIEENL